MNVCGTAMLFVYFSIFILELFTFVSYICPTLNLSAWYLYLHARGSHRLKLISQLS